MKFLDGYPRLRHAHDIPRDSRVWAMIDDIPMEVVFRGILPYRGFRYSTDVEPHGETSSEAWFGESLEELVSGHIGSKYAAISEIEAEIERLRALDP